MSQDLINWVIAGAGAAFGWVLKVIWDAIQDLKKDVREIERDLPEVYVRKDDFKDAVSGMRDEVKEVRMDMKEGFKGMTETLKLLFERLDRKEDKPNGG